MTIGECQFDDREGRTGTLDLLQSVGDRFRGRDRETAPFHGARKARQGALVVFYNQKRAVGRPFRRRGYICHW